MSTSQHSSTGYGPLASGRYQNLQFNGDERKYEIWEVRFLGYMLMKQLKDTVDPTDPNASVDDSKNETGFCRVDTVLR